MPETRVLVVDDEPHIRALVGTYLREAHYSVIEASDGEEAIVAAKKTRPAVVFLDVNMPEMDGLTACAKLKNDPDLVGIQIIICTGRSSRDDLMKAIRAGADDYVSKPFDREMIVSKAAKALARTHTPRPAKGVDERRRSPRRSVRWTVTWHSPRCQSAFKCKVLDISATGLAFEFPGCKICSTESGNAGPHWPAGAVVDLVLALNTDVLLEIEGTVARITLAYEGLDVEKVGIAFKDLEPHAAALIGQYVEGRLQI